ncbi:hypothetical protein [Streptomyces cupreus]|uniref:hypothetical protein n=1 Tax=Streptomyces cupreus TaxID=2759956 RepID=UPI001C90C95F|nr:hypothetical protein [Streptomyces cupreus]
MAEQRDPRASSHDPLLELQIGDAAFVEAGVERDGDALNDCGLVFADGFGQAGQGREAGGREVLEPVRQRGGVAGVEHGGELTHQIVGAVQFSAVIEQPPECLGCVQVAAGWRGGDPQRPERARLGSCVLGRAGGCTVISMAVIGVLSGGRRSRFQML